MADNGKRAVDAYTVDAAGCWRWLGKKNPEGYGSLGGNNKRAHRVYYERYVAPIPEGLMVLHKCDVKDCVNPKHLYVGTNRDNMRDASERGQLRSPARRASWLEKLAKGRIRSLEVRRENARLKREKLATLLQSFKSGV